MRGTTALLFGTVLAAGCSAGPSPSIGGPERVATPPPPRPRARPRARPRSRPPRPAAVRKPGPRPRRPVRTAADRDGDGLPNAKDPCPDLPGPLRPTAKGQRPGCPHPILARLQFGEFWRIGILKPIRFKTNTAVLLRRSMPVLDQVADLFKSRPGLFVEIQGHTTDPPRY